MNDYMYHVRFLLVCLVILFAGPTRAQVKEFRVAQGSVTGTYGEAFTELATACSTESLPLVPAFQADPARGYAIGDGASNLEALVNGKAQAAFVRNDVIFAQGRNGQLGHIKTLFTLWSEPVHLVARTQTSIVTKNAIGWKSTSTITLNTILDLHGRRVAAAGANQITASVLKDQLGINYEIIAANDGKSALAMLDAGQVEAVIFTAGKPLPIISGDGNKNKGLDTNYKLLAIPPDIAKRTEVYRPTTLTYSNLAQSFNVPTVEADSIFVTKVVNTEIRTKQLAELRSCFFRRLGELKDEGSARWQNVDAKNQGRWPWYELPTATPAVYRPNKK